MMMATKAARRITIFLLTNYQYKYTVILPIHFVKINFHYGEIKMDIFTQEVFKFSTLKPNTTRTYSVWIDRLCLFSDKPHPLDITAADVTAFMMEKSGHSHATTDNARAAILYFYTRLLRDAPATFQAPEELREEIKAVFHGRRSHSFTLPTICTDAEWRVFVGLLPETPAGDALRTLGKTGKPIDRILDGMQRSPKKSYLSQVAAKTARRAGIIHGFGLRGVRAYALVSRLRCRQNDTEIAAIMQDAELQWPQFSKYVALAGGL